VSALQVLQTMFLSGKTLHELKQGMKKFPQQIINLSYQDGRVSLETPAIAKLIKDCEEKLQPHGRVLLRYSGTEPVLRIMTEGEDETIVKETAQMLSDELSRLFNH
jgi:phosphoglucosamine mutase